MRFETGAWLCVGGGLVGWAGNCFGGGWDWLGWAWFEEFDGSEFDGAGTGLVWVGGTGLVWVVFCEPSKRGKFMRLVRAFAKSFCIYTVPLFT